MATKSGGHEQILSHYCKMCDTGMQIQVRREEQHVKTVKSSVGQHCVHENRIQLSKDYWEEQSTPKGCEMIEKCRSD